MQVDEKQQRKLRKTQIDLDTDIYCDLLSLGAFCLLYPLMPLSSKVLISCVSSLSQCAACSIGTNNDFNYWH